MSISRGRAAAVVPLALGAVAIVLAACGGSGGLGVASLGGSTSTTLAAPSETASPTDYAKDVAYARCMRTHGVPEFPDPNAQGDFLLHAAFARRPQLQKANLECEHLEPNGGQQTAADNALALKYGLEAAECMRSHGVPNFPDPQSLNGGVALRFGGRGENPNSSAFVNAMRACQSLFNEFGAVP